MMTAKLCDLEGLTEREETARDIVNAFYLLKIVGNGAYDPKPDNGEKS